MDLTALYQRYYPIIYQQIRLCVRQHEQTEDLTQDTFVKALRALDHAPEAPDKLRRWLGCIARNTVIDHVRHTQRITWSQLYESSSITTSDLAETVGIRQTVQTVLSELPTEARQTLLAWGEGYTIAEIGQFLGISPSLARVRLFRARQQFKQRYLALQEGEDREDQEVLRCPRSP